MSRVVAFEGPDLTGKTSLLEVLQQRMPFSMWPRLSYSVTSAVLKEPGGETLDETVLAYHEGLIVASKQMPFVLDRCYVSSYVYGMVFGRKVSVSRLASVAKRLSPVIIFVDTPNDVLLERLKWRGDDFVERGNDLVRLAETYRAWAQVNPFGDTVFAVEPVTFKSKEETVDCVEAYLRGVMGL